MRGMIGVFLKGEMLVSDSGCCVCLPHWSKAKCCAAVSALLEPARLLRCLEERPDARAGCARGAQGRRGLTCWAIAAHRDGWARVVAPAARRRGPCPAQHALPGGSPATAATWHAGLSAAAPWPTRRAAARRASWIRSVHPAQPAFVRAAATRHAVARQDRSAQPLPSLCK